MKVHFADANCFGNSNALLDAGVKYTLQTYHQIYKNRNKLSFNFEFLNKFNHIIIDSGLFSIMFGCDKDKHFDSEFAENWQTNYINWIKTTNFRNASFVELDVQKKLGKDYAWDLRSRLKSELPNSSLINVYHLEDENPDKLIDYSNYIAVSIPELRFNVSRKELLKITRYITKKASLKNKKIHLLGCTEKSLMKEFSFCYSCDSTSWRSGQRYGFIDSDLTGKIHISNSKIINSENRRYRDFYLSAKLKLTDYEKYAGDQS